MDIFSTGRRIAIALGSLGLIIASISAAISFNYHANLSYYSGSLITGNFWLYVGLSLIILAFLAFIGDVRYSAIQQREQEIEGGKRLRSAEARLAQSLEAGTTADKEGGESATRSRLNADDALALSVLWELTNARLAQYHGIATGQARRSFVTAQSAIVIGFLLLIGFAILSFRTHSATASITTAALGAVAAALTGYISRTFVRSQETSARHLRAYFDQPLEFSRYLAAERLLSGQSDTKPEERDVLLRIIIKAMVESPATDRMWESEPWDNLREGFRDYLESRGQSKETGR